MVRRVSRIWWTRRWRTDSPPSASPTTATCTGSSTSTRPVGTQDIVPIIGTEAYMAGESRHERPVRRGRVDDTGGDVEGGQKLYYHLTLLAETVEGYRNLHEVVVGRLPRGLLLQAPAGLGAARAPPHGAHRHHRLPGRGRAPGAAGRRLRRGREAGRPAPGHLRARATSSSRSRTTGSRTSTAPTRS